MSDAPISVFISYKHTDRTFVDQIEADLLARQFRVWVDRAELRAGEYWRNEIQQAIDSCHVLLVVLSPEAMRAHYVLSEYSYALSLGKRVIPLLYQQCKVPIDLVPLQWISFNNEYDKTLKDLLVALNPIELKDITETTIPLTKSSTNFKEYKEPELVDPPPPPPSLDPSLLSLYMAGMKAKAQGNLERTAILWQQILDRDPLFGKGTFAPEMTQLLKELHPIRVQRLRDLAAQASQAGEWGQEIGAWKALLRFIPNDTKALRCLPIAEKNLEYLWMYECAGIYAEEGDQAATKAQLLTLWKHAPQYYDPKGLALKAKVPVPLSPDVKRANDLKKAAKTAAIATSIAAGLLAPQVAATVALLAMGSIIEDERQKKAEERRRKARKILIPLLIIIGIVVVLCLCAFVR